MRCFARWEQDDTAGVFFRDQTILQFGDNWELLANLVLLNPGSALPLNGDNQTHYLRSKQLPYFVEPKDSEKYVEFSIDRLMNDVIKLFSGKYSGGTIKLHNLFNLRNQYSGIAVQQLLTNRAHPKMFAQDEEIVFGEAPVIVASGGNAKHNPLLKSELARFVAFADPHKLFAVRKTKDKEFAISKAVADKDNFVESYHPSYTFKYGNTTSLGDL